MRKVNLIVIHCSSVKPSQTSSAKQIDAWHRKRGWKCIGYHYVIRRDGNVERGRPESQIGAHVAGYNSHSIGVCYEGGLNEQGKSADTRTPQQKSALLTLLAELKERFPEARIVGHRDLSPDKNHDGTVSRSEWIKDCPCFDAIPEYSSI